MGDSTPGSRSTLPQPLCEVTNMTPITGSATAGPVIFAPPAPPGQTRARPAPASFPAWTGGLNSGARKSPSVAMRCARSYISGV